ncbi:MAG: TerC family protein [Dehalobacterium sp.]
MGLGEVFMTILSISMINLVLSGDNAIVISLAMRDLPKRIQKKTALAASLGAIILRVIFTIFAVYILKIKYLSAIGGMVLIWITYNLIKFNGEEVVETRGRNRFWSAVWTIIIADLSMAFDNVLGVAGAANGQFWLVILGLVLSIPVLIFGSTWLATLMTRWPLIIYIGGMILLHTAVSMIVRDSALTFLDFMQGHTIYNILPWLFSVPLLIYGIYATKKQQMRNES